MRPRDSIDLLRARRERIVAKKGARREKRKRNWVKEYGEALLIAGVLFVFLRGFVVQAFQIPSGSMEDTLLIGDFLVANKFLYGARVPWTDYRLPAVRQPERGDIIVFRAPHVDKDFIKRCVAVEGDTVQLSDNVLHVNGVPQKEDFTVFKGGGMPPAANWGPKVVPPGHLFMLGDNRNQSQDSRYWGFLDKKRVRGRAMFLYFSWDKDRFLPRLGRLLRIIR
jgi:signal peptidase I